MKKNVFVIGLDEFNLRRLQNIRGAENYRFHGALDLETVQGARTYPLRQWLEQVQERMDAFEGSIDGIIGFWDFPVSPMVPILCERYHTSGPTLRSVISCEHKYWSRRKQKEVVPDHVPRFTAVNPFAEDPLAHVDLEFPFWLKPVKAFASQLGFRIDNESDFGRAVEKLRRGIARFAEPFNTVLSYVDLPSEIARVDGYWCIAEEIMSGTQCTIAGYVTDSRVKTYGLIDSINYRDSSSFFRYQYPSRLPETVRERLSGISRRVMAHVGFEHSPFNIEYFYDEKHDTITLLEINTRISQSHSYLFEQVDGASNHQVLVETALGLPPEFPRGEGPHSVCDKIHYRRFSDGIVRRVPDDGDIARVREEFPDARVLVQVREGDRLSELVDQDSYSYRLAVVYAGGRSEQEVMEKYDRIIDMLNFEIEDV